MKSITYSPSWGQFKRECFRSHNVQDPKWTVKFSIQLPCWSPGFEVLSIKHDQIAWLVCRCGFGFLILVLPHYFAGFIKSLATELMNAGHQLNMVLRSRIMRGFCSWLVCSRVIAIVRTEWCHFDCGMERIVEGIFCHWQHFFPIILLVIAVISTIAFQCLVYSFCLSIGLGIKGWWHFGFHI